VNVRTSTQVPFLVREELERLLGVEVRVFTARVGGGFGGKQELLVDDVVALAALRTGRPVRVELTREEQFAATTTRHAMRVQVRAGARADGVLTALELSLLSDTGAYGNHGPGVMFHALGESLGVYRCPNKRRSGRVAYTHTVPAGAVPRVRLSQTGAVMNAGQCRAQVQGGVVKALGAALFEEVAIDADGEVVTRNFRSYHRRADDGAPAAARPRLGGAQGIDARLTVP